jgi:hypothetical protein
MYVDAIPCGRRFKFAAYIRGREKPYVSLRTFATPRIAKRAGLREFGMVKV